MSRSQKIIWNEGMFLGPHHFQGWERYQRDLQNVRIKSLNPFDWGITEIDVNEEDLASGSFSLLRCSGIMPDGLPFSIPQSDRTPATRPIGDRFSHAAEKLDVFLGIPVEHTDAPNCRFDHNHAGRETRYLGDTIAVNDENTGENRREVSIGRANFKILFSGDLLDDVVSLKIAELGRNPSGRLCLREHFVPASLSIGGSKRIINMLHGLLDKLTGMSGSLSQQLKQKSASLYDIHAQDLNHFALQRLINGSIPLLRHYYSQVKVHPEQLYRCLARFAGELSTFSTKLSSRDIPSYNHDALTTTFDRLEQVLLELLEISVGTGCVQIQLNKTAESRLQGEVAPDLLENALFFLGATARIDEGQASTVFPQMIKISRPEQMDFLIQRALRGIPILHTERPHASIPVKVGYKYFQLDTKGEIWDGIKQARRLAVYHPAGLPDLNVELFAVRQ